MDHHAHMNHGDMDHGDMDHGGHGGMEDMCNMNVCENPLALHYLPC
jgi:hypothetical protein